MRVSLPLCASLLLIGGLTGPAALSASSGSAERTEREQAELDKALAGKVAGKPVSCISLRDAKSTKYIGEDTILFRVSKNLTYRNDPVGGCLGLDHHSTLITRTPTGRLCRGDIATVSDLLTGFTAGSCGLGDFVPYRPG